MIAEGRSIVLVDLQTTDYMTAPDVAGFRFFVGTAPSTASCAGSADTTCGHHLDGMTMFTPMPVESPLYPAIAGRVTDGVLDGTYAGLSSLVQIGLVPGLPLSIPCEHLRIVATGSRRSSHRSSRSTAAR